MTSLFLTSHKTRRILDSLLPPASDVVRHVGPGASPNSPNELLVKFISALQNQGEKPSTYLCNPCNVKCCNQARWCCRFSTEGLSFKQFCRGCWDNNFIADLQLERRKVAPPSFAELIVVVHTEENKQFLKEERMKKHIGINKHVSVPVKLRTATHQQSVYCTDASDEPRVEVQNHQSPKQMSDKPKNSTDKSEVDVLKKEVAKLQAQIFLMTTDPVRKEKTHNDENELK